MFDEIKLNRIREVDWLVQYMRQGSHAGPPIFLSLGETWEQIPAELIDLLAKAPRYVHGYQIAMAGYPPLRQKAKRWLEAEYALSPAQQKSGLYEVGICATGTRSLMYDYAHYLKYNYAKGRKPLLITMAPSWDYAGVFSSAGFSTQYIPLKPENNFAPDVEDILLSIVQVASNSGLAPVFALNAQQNPSALNWPVPVLYTLLKELINRRIPVLIDDAYFALTSPGEEPSCAMRILLDLIELTDATDYTWLLTRSLGKQFSCNGWGVGIAAAPSPVLESLFNEWHIKHHYNINGLFQYAMSEWLATEAEKTYTHSLREKLYSARLQFLRLLETRLGYPTRILQQGNCTNFQLFPLPHKYACAKGGALQFVEDCVMKTGVLFTDAWPLPYNVGKEIKEYNFARVFLAAGEEKLEEAITRMETAGLFYYGD